MIHEHEFYWFSNSVHTKGFCPNGSVRTLQIAHDDLKFEINIKKRVEWLEELKKSADSTEHQEIFCIKPSHSSLPTNYHDSSNRKYVVQPKIKY